MSVETLLLSNPLTVLPMLAYQGFRAQDDATDAKKAQKKLEDERKAQIAKEMQDRGSAAVLAQSSGQRAGASSRSTFLSTNPAPGFGTGNVTPEASRGTLFGN